MFDDLQLNRFCVKISLSHRQGMVFGPSVAPFLTATYAEKTYGGST